MLWFGETTILVDQIRITIIKTPQLLLYRREILLKDEMSLDVTDLNLLLLNSLLLGIAPDVLLLGIQTTFLSLEKKPLEPSVVISAEILIILPNIIVVDDSNDETDLHHQVILTLLFRHEEDIYDQGSLKEAVDNDAHQMKKCSCLTVTLNIITTPR